MEEMIGKIGMFAFMWSLQDEKKYSKYIFVFAIIGIRFSIFGLQ